ncbi:hypothetical protein GCM10010472_30360 [Pseudonocardia halophobica]|uniref:DUF2637 domain-containing protein n=1 Tax=Pseudonocardia halophobica TaxID=29401 RepID=A0A9W6NTH5_9PSEU|nr:hypothetical protein [Pseudonocardia halophobica]GLL09295.1 hypothetical protein GCM10017577_04350 [Pseudonocardia halophobica]
MSWKRTVVWLPGLAVAVGAAIATAHGLYEVAVASRVPQPLAWLYPLITDGLALVAYTATARLQGSAARYAWTVVVVAAGMSGLAQAVFLAGDAGALTAPAWLRFGIGAWPAIAAAVVAHLLYLLADHGRTANDGVQRSPNPVHPVPVPAVAEPGGAQVLGPAGAGPGQTDTRTDPTAERMAALPTPQPSAPAPAPAREKAQELARAHFRRHRTWPTVTELQDTAGVSRGTAAAALRALRDDDHNPETAPIALHLITSTTDSHTSDTSQQTTP